MRRPVGRAGALVAAALALVLGVTGCSTSPPSASQATPNLEVISWWTSGSEQEALNVLFDRYRADHGGVAVVNATVAGGGGSNAQVVLAQRLISGNPPDAWQTFPGGALSAFVAQGQVRDVSSVYAQDGLATVLPKTILDGLTVNGHQYGVPTSAHRGNMLFFNRALLTRAGVALPGAGYTADQFRDDLATLDHAGITPLCLGAKDPFTTTALFENTLLGVVGPDGWQRIIAGRFDWNGTQARTALGRFGAILDHADPEASALSWDAATRKLGAGGCAFESMNDSAYGELLKAGAVDGRDFGEVPYPGTDASYVAVVDTFVVSSRATNAKNAVDFLSVIGTADTEIAFSKAKGSVPVRTDADVSSLTPYQQSAAQSLRSGTVLWSITHGEATSPRFQQGFYDAVASYVRSRDPGAFSKTLNDALVQQPPVN